MCSLRNERSVLSYLTCFTQLQLDQKCEQHKLTALTLDEKRAELLAAETQLHELEDKYYNSTSTLSDKVVEDLRVSV